MSLQRRLLIYLLVSAPLVWAVALYVSVDRARSEVNELFDTEMIRLSRRVQATLGSMPHGGARAPRGPLPAAGTPAAGAADVRDLAIAAWDAQGRQVLIDGDGMQLQRRVGVTGFVEEQLAGEAWRVYYLESEPGGWLVATGQAVEERDELVLGLTASQVVPWLLMLPVLLVAMAWAVRNALAPVHQLTAAVRRREPDDLRPVAQARAPSELRPLIDAMNGLFERVGQALDRERRFTADAAHELRTPLAILRAQWDVLRRSRTTAEREEAQRKLGAGLDRMDRLVTQMLALSQVESATALPRATEVRWQAVVEQAMSDCLPLAGRRHMELACEWPQANRIPMPLLGDEHLLALLLRNLLDNALRYGTAGTQVTVRFGEDRLEVENEGTPLTAPQREHLGERFRRDETQPESGSGLGVSIVQRIARLHGLSVNFGACDDGQGVKAVVRYATPSVDGGSPWLDAPQVRRLASP
jgi:two-component system sensor histidine kinase QseC